MSEEKKTEDKKSEEKKLDASNSQETESELLSCGCSSFASMLDQVLSIAVSRSFLF